MATSRPKHTKDGTLYYEITVSRGRGQSRPTTKWYPPANWSKKAIDRELKKVEAEFERKVKSGEIVTKREQMEREKQEAAALAEIMTFKRYCEEIYMPAFAVRCSENSRSNYQSNLNHWIYPAVGDCRITEITPVQIEAIFTTMQKKKLAHATVVKVYTVFSGIFKKARKTGVIQSNPMELVDRPKPRKEEQKKKQPDTCSIDEVRYIWGCLESEPLKWKALIHVLIDTGMRRGECTGLRWKDLDFQNNTITICQTLNYTPDKGVYVDTTKNSKVWTIDVSPYVMKLLRQLRAEQGKTCLSQYVFTQDGSTEPMHPQSPYRRMKRFEQKYGIKDLHPHKLRHSFASIAITNGADIASVSEILGHSDKGVTLKMYTHASRESMKQAGNVYREALRNTGAEYAKNA